MSFGRPSQPPAGVVRIGLVGGGNGGAALLDLLLDWPQAQVAVVVDPRPEAPALGKAKAIGIPTTADHLAVFTYPVDVVFEVTGQAAVLDDLLRARPAEVEIIGAERFRFFRSLLQGQVDATRQLAAQLDLAEALGSAMDPKKQHIAIATQKLAQACGVDRCTFFLLDDASGLVTPVTSQFATGEPNEPMWNTFKALGHLTLADVPFFDEVMKRRSPIEIDEPASSPLLPPGWVDLFHIKSLLILPILRKDRFVGVCFLDYCREARRFTQEQTALAMTLARQVSLVLENTRLYRRAEERAEKLTALGMLTQLITSMRAGKQVFQEVAKAAVTLLGAKMAHVWVSDPAQGVLRIEAGFGLDPNLELPLLEYPAIPYRKGVIGGVFRSRLPEYILDVQQEPRWLNKRVAEELGLHSYAALPLITGEHVAGILDMLFATRRVFTPEERELMSLLAGQATVTINNARLFEEAERRRQTAESLAQTGRLITQSLDLEELGRRITDSLRLLLGTHASALYQLRPDSGDLVAVAISGEDGAALTPTRRFSPGAGAAGLAVLKCQLVASPDLLTDPRITLPPESRTRIERGPFRSGLAVPLLIQNRAIGALTVRDRVGRVFDSDDSELAQALADQAAVALENARLYGEATRRQHQAEELARLAQIVTASLELPEVLESVARSGTDLLPDSASRIWVADGDRLVLRADFGIRGTPRSGLKTELALGEGLTGHVALTREPLVVEDVLADPRCVNTAWMREEGCVSLLSIPLVVRDRLVGVLSLLTRHRHHFSNEELDSLASFGNQVAIAIENAKLLRELRTHQGRLETLLRASCELSRIQPLESLLGGIARACGDLLGSDSVGIRVLEGDDLVMTGWYGEAREAMPTTRIKVGESLSGIVAATGEPLVVRDLANDPRMLPAHREAYRRGDWAWLGVPIKLGKQMMGVVSLRTRRKAGFSPDDLAIATAFASQAAVALENSRLYHEIRRAYDDLSQTQDQLTQAQKMEAVGRLAGGIAHDFNNLLTVILGRAQLLLRPLNPEDPLCRSIELIQKTAGRAADLTRQLLAFSRKQILQPAVLDLNVVASDMDKMLPRLIGEDIALITALDPALGRVKADRGQVEQVIMNLAVNARDAMPQGGRLTIETANVELDDAYVRHHVGTEPGPHVMLAVSDTGAGISREIQAHIFEPFFTTKGVGQGTGLGLATVYGIVKQSGGSIEVYSEPGQGTTFKIYLPRIDEVVQGGEGWQPAALPLRGTETILLVEDEDGVRELARDILQAEGYTVLDASHGRAALVVCNQHPSSIHLLITDVVMPEMSGRELAERLAALRPEMKVVYMSGYTEHAVVHHGVLDPDTAFLQKPFTPLTLARKVREVLDAPKMACATGS